jgi:hypothetical protein
VRPDFKPQYRKKKKQLIVYHGKGTWPSTKFIVINETGMALAIHPVKSILTSVIRYHPPGLPF